MDSEQRSAASNFQKSVETSTITVGAAPPSNGDAMTWASTVQANPVPITYSLSAIHSLFTERYTKHLPGVNLNVARERLINASKNYCQALKQEGRIDSCDDSINLGTSLLGVDVQSFGNVITRFYRFRCSVKKPLIIPTSDLTGSGVWVGSVRALRSSVNKKKGSRNRNWKLDGFGIGRIWKFPFSSHFASASVAYYLPPSFWFPLRRNFFAIPIPFPSLMGTKPLQKLLTIAKKFCHVENAEIKKRLVFFSCYYIKETDFIFPCVCSVIDHRRHQNAVRTSATFVFTTFWRFPF